MSNYQIAVITLLTLTLVTLIALVMFDLNTWCVETNCSLGIDIGN